MTCNDDRYDNCDDSGVDAWVIVLIVVLGLLKAIFWTLICYCRYRRRRMFVPRVTVATVCTQATTCRTRPAGTGQVAYSGPLAGQVPVQGTALPVYPPAAAAGGNYPVAPPYNPGNLPTAVPATAPPADEEEEEPEVKDSRAPLLP